MRVWSVSVRVWDVRVVSVWVWECESVKCEFEKFIFLKFKKNIFCESVRVWSVSFVSLWEWECESCESVKVWVWECYILKSVSLWVLWVWAGLHVLWDSVSQMWVFEFWVKKCVFWVWQHFVSRLGYLLRCTLTRFLSFLSRMSKVSVWGSNKGFPWCGIWGGWGFEKLKTPVLLSLGLCVGRVLTWLVYVSVFFEISFLWVVPVGCVVFSCMFWAAVFWGWKVMSFLYYDIFVSEIFFCIYISSSCMFSTTVLLCEIFIFLCPNFCVCERGWKSQVLKFFNFFIFCMFLSFLKFYKFL